MQRHALSRPSLSRSSTRDARRRLLALALALAVPAALALVSGQGPASAGQGSPTVTKTGVETFGAIKTTTSTVGWLLRCAYSHSGTNDPIMMPSMTGMSHLHDFFGNVSTSADSTLASMEASKTSCGTSADTAAYWAPALLVHGKLIPPDQTSQQIYYRSKYASGVTVVPLPQDLRVVVGSSMATRVADNAALTGAAAGNQGIYWECDGNTTVHYTLPPSCSRGVSFKLLHLNPNSFARRCRLFSKRSRTCSA